MHEVSLQGSSTASAYEEQEPSTLDAPHAQSLRAGPSNPCNTGSYSADEEMDDLAEELPDTAGEIGTPLSHPTLSFRAQSKVRSHSSFGSHFGLTLGLVLVLVHVLVLPLALVLGFTLTLNLSTRSAG